MSAMTATFRSESVVVLTDAAFYDDQGVLVGLRTKCCAVPGLKSAVFAARGHAFAFELFDKALEGETFENWRDFVGRMEPLWRRYESAMAEVGGKAEVMVAGWCDHEGKGKAMFRFNYTPKEGRQPHVTYFTDSGHLAGAVDPMLMGDPEAENPEAAWISAFEAARDGLYDLTYGVGPNRVWGHAIGGWLDMTVVNSEGAFTGRLCRWDNDRIGSKIMPNSSLLAHQLLRGGIPRRPLEALLNRPDPE